MSIQWLADDERARKQAYDQQLRQAISEEELAAIRGTVNQGGALGSARFQRQIEELTGRSAGFRRRGRPRKVPGK